MNVQETLRGKRVLVVDDEKDVLAVAGELLGVCKIDTASTFEQAKDLLENNFYHIAVLDIMGVRGYDLLEIATKRGIPALMLTAHALTKEDLKKSAEKGASFYVPKDASDKIDLYVADVLEAKEKKKNVWAKWYRSE